MKAAKHSMDDYNWTPHELTTAVQRCSHEGNCPCALDEYTWRANIHYYADGRVLADETYTTYASLEDAEKALHSWYIETYC